MPCINFVILLEYIRRECVYDGMSTYWYPNSNIAQQLCPSGTQRVSDGLGMIANQVVKFKFQ